MKYYLFSGQSDSRVLALNLFLGKTVHYHSKRLVRAQRNDAESLRLSICPILEELYVLKVCHTHVLYSVGDVLVRCPLKSVFETKPTGQVELNESPHSRNTHAWLHTSLFPISDRDLTPNITAKKKIDANLEKLHFNLFSKLYRGK